jgi:hypothetical protein
MDKITFMGHVLSKNGIGPTSERVKDILNATEPKNASEVKSFLGLVNFSARYTMSSDIFCTPSISWNTCDTTCWYFSGAALILNIKRLYLYKPLCVTNVVISRESSNSIRYY